MDCISFDKKMYILRNIMQIKQVSEKKIYYVLFCKDTLSQLFIVMIVGWLKGLYSRLSE